MTQPKIIELKLDDDALISGIEAIAMVEQPAIEVDFHYFSKQYFEETYNDYPKKAIENAKRGIELNKENNQKCATQVGKVRAQQLANGENLSLDTIRRMRAFLIRQKDNYELARDRKDYNACGYISYLLWGGEEALPWAEKKLRQAGEEFEVNVSALPNYSNEVSGSVVPKLQFNNETEKAIFEAYLFEKLIEFEGLEDACQAGYKAIGLKTKNGRKVPNCVPEQNFEDDWVIDLTDDIEDAVYNALINVGKTEDDLIDEGYDFEKAIAINNEDEFIAHQFVASVGEIKRASQEDKPSNDDFGSWQVLYRYMNYTNTESINPNSRQFCKNVIKANKWFRKEDINKLTIAGANEGFGQGGSKFYDIFTYKGGTNCKHYWQAFMIPRSEEASKRKRPTAVLDRRADATSLNAETLQRLLADDPNFIQAGSRLQFSQEIMDEQQVIATPIMIPDKLIPRLDEDGNKYFVYFTKDTIKKLAYRFAEMKNQDKINHEHDMESMVDNVYLAEQWIVEESANDKSNMYGYSLPQGTWFGLFKVNNSGYWKDYVKSGKVKGVSVEGYFVNKLTKLQ